MNYAIKENWKFLLKHALLVLYLAHAFPILDYGDVVHDSCAVADTNALKGMLTAAGKLTLVCRRTTSYENILRVFGLTPLHIRRHFHIFITFRNALVGPCSFFSAIATKVFQLFIAFISQCTAYAMQLNFFASFFTLML